MTKKFESCDEFEWLSIPWLRLSPTGDKTSSNKAFRQLSLSAQTEVIRELNVLVHNSSVRQSGYKCISLLVDANRYRAELLLSSNPLEPFHCFLHLHQVAEVHAQSLYSSVFRQSGEAIMITDADDEIIDVNHAFEQKTGYILSNIRYKKPTFLRLGLDEEETLRRVWQDIKNTGHWSGELKNRKANGEYYVCWLSLSAIKDDTGQVSHHISIFSDITQHIQEHKKYKQLAYHDFLTTLPNRALLEDRFDQFVLHNKRQGTNDKCAIVFIDINRFKSINDTYGHHTGDKCLISVANILKACIRADDTACRFSGDEFVLLLTEIQSDSDPERIIESVALQISGLHSELGITSAVSLSAGVSLYPADGADLEALIAKADQRMYLQKKSD